MHYALVTTTRRLATIFAVPLALAPITFAVLALEETYLTDYPTVRLLAIIASVGAGAFGLTCLVPRAEQLFERIIFPGSYSYYRNVEQLTLELTTRSSLADIPERLASRLSSATDAKVAVLEGAEHIVKQKHKTIDQLMFVLAEHPLLVLWLGPKRNGDLWAHQDRDMLLKLVILISPLVRLAHQKRYEELRHRQVRELLRRNTSELDALHERLAGRDPLDRLHFDQLAHDLKNPVIVLSFALQDPETKGSAIASLQTEVAWMSKFIDHVLELSRSGAGKIKPKPERTDLVATLYDLVDELQDLTCSQKQEIFFRPVTESLEVHADPFLLYRLFQLLLVRAIRLTTSGLLIELWQDQKTTQIDVILSPLEQRLGKRMRELLDEIKLQRPTFQDRRAGITGLELHLANWIAKAHGGTISIPEADERRTVLRITFPRGEAKPGDTSV
ncbi:MAG: hypothetical protein V1895_02515 [Parcubacteria group bacterium]